jgi:hypothetical protein
VTRAHSDFDDNARVEWGDLLNWLFCYGGPGGAYSPGHYCTNGDFDGDTDLDLRDLQLLQRVFTGP